MKKLVLAILAVGSIATAQAQRAGSMLIYGNIGFEGHKSTDDAGLPGSRDVVTKALDSILTRVLVINSTSGLPSVLI